MGHCRRHLHSNSQSPYRNLAFLHVFSSALFLLPFRSLQYRPRLTRETRITSKHWHTLPWLTFLPLQALIAVSFANFCVQAAFGCTAVSHWVHPRRIYGDVSVGLIVADIYVWDLGSSLESVGIGELDSRPRGMCPALLRLRRRCLCLFLLLLFLLPLTSV